MAKDKPLVGILMGSDSDRAVMEETGRMLDQFGIPWELRISSAHRSPDKTLAYVRGADKRGIEDGVFIKVFNDRGYTIAVARISDDVMDGVVMLPTGAWFDPTSPSGSGGLEKHGNPNVLTLDKGTSKLGQGPIAHTTLVDVGLFEGEPPPVSAFELPEIVPLADPE